MSDPSSPVGVPAPDLPSECSPSPSTPRQERACAPADPTRRGCRVTARDLEDWNTCVRLVRRRGVPRQDAGDVASRVLFALRGCDALHEAAGSPLPAGERFALCWGIVRCLVRSYWSRRHRGQQLRAQLPLDMALVAAPSVPLDERVAAHVACERALAELKRRSSDQHAILVAYHIEGQRMPEIARAMGICTNTAWTRIRAASEALRRILRAQGFCRGSTGLRGGKVQSEHAVD
jgi:DNA-directed RNA polymerase specialized sigma24 family protein